MSGALGNNGGRLYSFGSQPVLIDCNFVVDATNGNGLGIRSLKGQGVENVFMHTSATPGKGPNGLLNPNPASGYAWVQLSANYNRYLGGFSGFVAPVTGGAVNIDSVSAALTIGQAYVITSVGHAAAGTATIAPVADSSGSLASTYFTLFDAYGNTWIIWFSVSGVGARPNLGPAAPDGVAGLHYVQQSIASGDTAATIGAALVLTIENLPSGIAGVFSFTASGTTTVTVVNTNTKPYHLPGIPQDGTSVIPDQGPPVPITFTISSGSATAGSVWTDGSGHLYTVSATISSQTTLHTTGVGAPVGGTLTFVSGSGASTALSFSAAVAGFATGFTFALTVNDFNLLDWQGVGLPKGLTPTIGQAFIAKATGFGKSTGQVHLSGNSTIASVEVIGDPNTTMAPQPQGGSAYVGGWILVQLLKASTTAVTSTLTMDSYTPAGVITNGTPDTFAGTPAVLTGSIVNAGGATTLAPGAPTAGSVVGMSFYVDVKFSPSNIGL